MTSYASISGRLGCSCVLHGTLSGCGELSGTVYLPERIRQTYEGPYEAYPHISQQVLGTKNKLMTDDITIHTISITRTDNPAGGRTVYIGI